MNNNQLKELIIKIGNQQDKTSFGNIFNYFAPRILGYLISTGSTKEVGEEITQEVLSTVWQKAMQFDYKKGNVSTWIFTIARNKRIDRIRKNENPFYDTLDLIGALYPNNDIQNNDLEVKVIEMLSKLDENEKKIIKMNFFEGKSHKYIALDLEIPLGTVKSRIRNILKKMK